MKAEITKFIDKYAKHLVKNEREFLIELGLNIPENAEFEDIDLIEKRNAIIIASELESLVSDRLKMKEYFTDKRMSNEYLCRRYFYEVLHKEIKKDFRDIATVKRFNSVYKFGKNLSFEKIKNDAENEKSKKQTMFKKLLNEHFEDVIAVAGNDISNDIKELVFEDGYVGKVEKPFERRLFAVMLLKSLGIFTHSQKLENVIGIGGGYFMHWENFGIKFTFGNKNFIFSDGEEVNGFKRIPHKKEQFDVINQINSVCNSKYVIKEKD